MLLIHTQQISSRLDYAFKHICTRILGVKVQFTSVIEEFIGHQGPKISYGKQPMGKELFFNAHGLLSEQGFEDIEIDIQPWGEGVGFFPTSEKSGLPFDIFAATFYLLSRYEEYVPHLKDAMGRFPAEESLAYRGNFLQKPVIDQWAYRLKEVLLQQFPTMQFPPKSYQVHHLVDASRPFAYANRGFLRNFSGFFRDLGRLRIKQVIARCKVLLKLRKDPFDTFTWMMNNTKNSSSRLTVFFLLGEGFTFKEDINSKRENYRSLVKLVNDYNEVGLLFSYHSMDSEERLKEEKWRMEELTHRSLESAMNDRWVVKLPHFYRSLLELEINKDMTLVYQNHLGFRAGTCTPFLFYDLDYEIKTPLIIHPLAGRTSALTDRSAGEMESEVYALRDSVRSVNGTYSLLFTNCDFIAEQTFWKRFFTET